MADPSQYLVHPETGETVMVGPGEVDAAKAARFTPATPDQIAKYDREAAAYQQAAAEPVLGRAKTFASSLGRGLVGTITDIPLVAATIPEALAGAAETIGTKIRPDLAEAYRRQTESVKEAYAPAKKVYREVTATKLEQSLLGRTPEEQKAYEETYPGFNIAGSVVSFLGPQIVEKGAEKLLVKGAEKAVIKGAEKVAVKAGERVAQELATDAVSQSAQLVEADAAATAARNAANDALVKQTELFKATQTAATPEAKAAADGAFSAAYNDATKLNAEAQRLEQEYTSIRRAEDQTRRIAAEKAAAAQASVQNPVVQEAAKTAQTQAADLEKTVTKTLADKNSLAAQALKIAQKAGTVTTPALGRAIAKPFEGLVERGTGLVTTPAAAIGERLVAPLADTLAESSVKALVDAAPAVRQLPRVTQEIVAKAAAQGAGSVIEAGLFQLGQGVHEDILGDHDLTAERVWAHMTDGALTNATLGAGSAVVLPALRGVLATAGTATKATRDVVLKHYPQLLKYMGYAPAEAELLIANREALRAGKNTLADLIEQQMQKERPLPPLVQPSLGEAIAGIQPPVSVPQAPGRPQLPPEVLPLGVPKPVAPTKPSVARMQAEAIVGLPPPVLEPVAPAPLVKPPAVPALEIAAPVEPLRPVPPSQVEAMAVDFTKALREERKATRALVDEVKRTVLPEQVGNAVNAEYAARTLSARQAYLDSIGGVAKTPEQLAQAMNIAEEILAPARQVVRNLSGPVASKELRALSQAATPIWVSRFESLLNLGNEAQRLSEVAKDARELQRGVARLQDQMWELMPSRQELKAMTEKEKVVAGMVLDLWRNFKSVSENPALWGEFVSNVTKYRNARTRFLTAEKNWMKRVSVGKKVAGDITLNEYDTDKVKKLLQRLGKPEEMDWVADYAEYRKSLRDMQSAVADVAQGYEKNYGAQEFADRLVAADAAETKAFDMVAKRTNHAAEVESFAVEKRGFDEAKRERDALVKQRAAELEQLKKKHGENTAAYKTEKAIVDAKNAEREAELTRRIEAQKSDYEARLAQYEKENEEYGRLVEERNKLVEDRKVEIERLSFEHGENTDAFKKAKRFADEANAARKKLIDDRISEIKDAPKRFKETLEARKQAARDRAKVLGELGNSGTVVDHLATAGTAAGIFLHSTSPWLLAASAAIKGGRIVVNPVKTMKTLAWLEKGGQITNKALQSAAELATGVGTGAVKLSMPIRASINMKEERRLYEERVARLDNMMGDPDSLTAHADDTINPIRYDAPKVAESAKDTKVRAIATVASAIPRPPPTLSPMERMKWQPTDTQVREFNRQYDAVGHPTGVFARSAEGTATLPEIKTVEQVYPALTEHYKQLLMENLRKNPNISAARRQMLRQFYGIDVDGSIRTGTRAQAVYGQQGQPPQAAGGKLMKVGQGKALKGVASREGAETQAWQEAQRGARVGSGTA
jgi:hypothetical protein